MASKLNSRHEADSSASFPVGSGMSGTEAAIWGRVFNPDQNEMSEVEARYLLRVDLVAADKQRAQDLLVKNREDALTPEEQVELDGYRRVGYLLDLMHAKARRALKKHSAPA